MYIQNILQRIKKIIIFFVKVIEHSDNFPDKIINNSIIISFFSFFLSSIHDRFQLFQLIIIRSRNPLKINTDLEARRKEEKKEAKEEDRARKRLVNHGQVG